MGLFFKVLELVGLRVIFLRGVRVEYEVKWEMVSMERGCVYLLGFLLVVLFFGYLFSVVMLLLGIWFVGNFVVYEVVF